MSCWIKRSLSLLLSIALVFQLIPGFQSQTHAYASSFISVDEYRISEDILTEERISEAQISPQYILENLIYEDGIYEYRLNEHIISQAYIIEVTVGVTPIEEIFGLLPEEIEHYDIDWLSVIGKFAVGTTIIIAVGVINFVSHGSTFFVFGSPARIAKDALIGGAIGAALGTLFSSLSANSVCDKAVLKYAVEGFADGYMWGAITSVLKIANENYKRLRAFNAAIGGTLRIKADGSVLDDAGRALGKAYYDSQQVWYLIDDTTRIVRVFDVSGKEIIGSAAETYLAQSATGLPANTRLRLGTGTGYKVCRTDANGVIYRIDDALVPNTEYQLNGYSYVTDALGRIERAEFPDLKLTEQPRLVIDDLSGIIGRGEWRATDHRGHLIADRFGGDNTMANIVPQASTTNLGPVAEIERNFYWALREGKHVSGSISVSYSGSSSRPVGFTYTYDIGSGEVVKRISN